MTLLYGIIGCLTGLPCLVLCWHYGTTSCETAAGRRLIRLLSLPLASGIGMMWPCFLVPALALWTILIASGNPDGVLDTITGRKTVDKYMIHKVYSIYLTGAAIVAAAAMALGLLPAVAAQGLAGIAPSCFPSPLLPVVAGLLWPVEYLAVLVGYCLGIRFMNGRSLSASYKGRASAPPACGLFAKPVRQG